MIEPAPNLTELAVPKKVLAQIPEAVARQYLVFPFAQDGDLLKVAMVNPDDQEAVEIIKAKTGKLIRAYKISQEAITKLLDQYSAILELTELELTPQDKMLKGIAQDSPAIKIIESIIRQATRQRASDIHIEPGTQGSTIRFRIDGLLRNVITLPKTLHNGLVSRIKILSKLKIDITRLPQDGRFQSQVETRNIDLRVSTYPTVEGEKVVMRILDKYQGLISLDKLGLVGRQYEKVEKAVVKPHGMTLVTGPTGSGKTTTLYAILQKLHRPEINIVTLEDPVEYLIPGVNQAQVNPQINFNFSVGLRSILRQDPDVVMIGEVRDLESAELAVQAALTGHIVLSTLHTNDATSAIPRLLDLGVPPFLINASLNLVVAQRLARKLCNQCKKPTKLLPADATAIQKIVDSLPPFEKNELETKGMSFYQPVGCHICGETGFSGRIGIFEVLELVDAIKTLVVKDVDVMKLEQQSRALGMLSLLQDGVLKAARGETNIQEIWRITRG